MLRTPLTRLTAAAALAAMLAACSGEGGGGGEAAPPVIKERQANFEAIGDNFKAVRGALEEDVPDFALIAARANDINTRAGQITGHFPEGTSTEDGFDTEALPAIWQKPEAFQAAAQKLVDESARLAQTAQGGDKAAVEAQAMALGGACKNCHDQFRLDDEK